MNIVPWLAEKWDISEDGKNYTFQLAKGVRFHNGREMTAEDVKFSFERILDPNTGSRRRANLEVIDSIEVLDSHLVKVNLKNRFSPFLAYLVGAYGAIIPKESLDSEGKVSHPVGTGPYKFIEWVKNDHLSLDKNQDYWRKGVPYLDSIVFKPLPDEAVRLTALRTGAVDIVHSLPEKMLPILTKKEQKEFTLQVMPGVSWRMVIMNNRKPPFDNVKLRQAVNYGLDREELMVALTWGFGTVKNQIWPKDSFWHMSGADLAYAPEKAKALLAEAGYPDGIDISLEVKPGYLPVAEVVQDQLNRVGFRDKLGVLDWASLKARMKNYEYQMAVSGAGWYSDPDARYGRFYSESGPANYFAGGYSNEKVTQLLQQGREEVDPAKRKAIYSEVFTTLQEEVPHLMLFHLPMTHAWRKDIKGFSVSAQGDLFFAEGGLPYTWKE
jgi:peptide/nickel transport system substrate-binding protein